MVITAVILRSFHAGEAFPFLLVVVHCLLILECLSAPPHTPRASCLLSFSSGGRLQAKPGRQEAPAWVITVSQHLLASRVLPEAM